MRPRFIGFDENDAFAAVTTDRISEAKVRVRLEAVSATAFRRGTMLRPVSAWSRSDTSAESRLVMFQGGQEDIMRFRGLPAYLRPAILTFVQRLRTAFTVD